MWKRNDGKNEVDILQNRFTRYLVTAVKRQKVSYIRNKRHLMGREVDLELNENEATYQVTPDMLQTLPLLQQLEDQGLQLAMRKMKERERYVFLERVLADRSFAELAAELGMGYKGVATTYYRAVKRIRGYMKEAEKNGF